MPSGRLDTAPDTAPPSGPTIPPDLHIYLTCRRASGLILWLIQGGTVGVPAGCLCLSVCFCPRHFFYFPYCNPCIIVNNEHRYNKPGAPNGRTNPDRLSLDVSFHRGFAAGDHVGLYDPRYIPPRQGKAAVSQGGILGGDRRKPINPPTDERGWSPRETVLKYGLSRETEQRELRNVRH